MSGIKTLQMTAKDGGKIWETKPEIPERGIFTIKIQNLNYWIKLIK